MNQKEVHLVDGIGFSARFYQELRSLWDQLGEDGPTTVADIQRTTRAFGDKAPLTHWGIHFVPRATVAQTDILTIGDFQVHILSHDRKLLRGKVVDLDNYLLIIQEEVKP